MIYRYIFIIQTKGETQCSVLTNMICINNEVKKNSGTTYFEFFIKVSIVYFEL